MSGSTYGVAEVFDGVQVYYSEDVMLQGAYYPENSRGNEVRLPFVVLPPGAAPGPAVMRVKLRMVQDAEKPGVLAGITGQLKSAAPGEKGPMFFKLLAEAGYSIEDLCGALSSRFPELKEGLGGKLGPTAREEEERRD